MPWALAVYLLLPFGLEAWALIPMGWGVAACNWLAHVTAALPGSVLWVPAMPGWGLTGIVLGGLWLMLWARRWRLWGLVPMALGFASLALADRPDLLISADGGVMAVRTETGDLSFNDAKAGTRLTAQTWLHRSGITQAAAPWPELGQSADGRLNCDEFGCLYRVQGLTVALIRDRLALAEDCDGTDLVVAAEPVHRCRAPHIIDLWALRRGGAHAVTASGHSLRIESVGRERGERPWTGVTSNRADAAPPRFPPSGPP